MIGEIESVALQRGLVQIWYTQKIVSLSFSLFSEKTTKKTSKMLAFRLKMG